MTFFYLINYSIIIAKARYITIETKEVGYNGFLFQHGYSEVKVAVGGEKMQYADSKYTKKSDLTLTCKGVT